MFIYIVNNSDWEYEHKYKFGFTKDPYNRLHSYHTNSSYPYKFVYLCHIVELQNYCINLSEYDKIFSQIGRNDESIHMVENMYNIHLPYLSQLHQYLIDNGGGNEFIMRSGKELIIKIINEEFWKLGLYADKIYDFEELELINKSEQNTTCTHICHEDLFIKNKTTINPSIEQYIILNKIKEFYNHNDIGKIIWPCGMGKTLLSLFIVQEMKFNHIVIGVPSIYLQRQFRSEINKLYPNINNVLYVGGESDEITQSTTDKTRIIDFIHQHHNSPSFIITTYDSCALLKDLYRFDFKIGDEAHHLVGEMKENSDYLQFHKILSNKSLFMTATEKIVESDSNKIICSMDNKKLFGELIDQKSICWAIEHKKITDYNILILSNTNEDIDKIIKHLNIEEYNRELIVSAYMSLKALEIYNGLTHILIYTNTVNHSDLIKTYVNKILESNLIHINHQDIYVNSLHSHNNQQLPHEIEKFCEYRFGIISCVYMFGEGFDLPKLNGVVFSENMDSDIRIVQSALRPNRLEKNNPNKISYIIIPMIDDSEQVQHQQFDKCRRIITKMGNFDEEIKSRVKLSSLKTNDDKENVGSNSCNCSELCDDIRELDRIMFKLFHRQGDKSTLIKYYIKRENKRRFKAHTELIDTRKKCRQFLETIGEQEYCPNPVNCVKYFMGKKLFNTIKNKYYYNKKDIIDVCKKFHITDFKSYEKNYVNDPRLPPPDYINEGFYYDLDVKFNINTLLLDKVDGIDV